MKEKIGYKKMNTNAKSDMIFLTPKNTMGATARDGIRTGNRVAPIFSFSFGLTELERLKFNGR